MVKSTLVYHTNRTVGMLDRLLIEQDRAFLSEEHPSRVVFPQFEIDEVEIGSCPNRDMWEMHGYDLIEVVEPRLLTACRMSVRYSPELWYTVIEGIVVYLPTILKDPKKYLNY